MWARRAATLVLAGLVLSGCGGSSLPAPVPTSVTPARGFTANATPITIHGDGFSVRTVQSSSGGAPTVDETFQAWMGDQPLQNVRRVDEQTLAATVPAGLVPGLKALRVQGPFGTSGELASAFTVEGTALASLTAGIAAAPATANVGQSITVTLTVTNTGSTEATNAVPAAPTVTGTGIVGAPTGPDPASIATLASGASGTFTWIYPATGAGSLAFAGSASAIDSFSGTVVTGATDPAAPALVTVVRPASLSASLPASGSAAVGREFTVTMTVANPGGAAAKNVVPSAPTMAPTGLAALKAGTGPVPTAIASLAAGASATFAWTYVAGSVPGTVRFTSSASGTDANSGAPVASGATTSGNFTIGSAGMNASLTATPTTASVGQVLTLTLTVTNPGLADVRGFTLGAPSVSSTDGANATRVSGPTPAPPTVLAAGQTFTTTWTYTPALVVGLSTGHLAFQVNLSGTDAISGGLVTAQPTASSAVQAPAALVATLTPGRTPPAPPVPAGLPFTVDVGQAFTLSLSVTNSGAAAANSVTPTPITECPPPPPSPSPASATVSPGTPVSFLYGNCRSTVAGNLTLSTSASGIDANNPALVMTSNPARASVIVQAPAVVTGALSIPSGIALNSTFTLTMTLSNTGGASALVVPGVPAVAAGSTGTASMTSGPTPASVTVPGGGTASVQWTYSATGVGTVSFTGSASGTGSNTGTALPAIAVAASGVGAIGQSVLFSTLAASPSPATIGQAVTFTMTVRNNGTAAVNNVTPALSLTGAAGTLGPATPASIVSLGTTAPSNTGTFTWTFTPTAAGTATGSASATGTDSLSQLPVTASSGASLQIQATLGGTVSGLTGSGLVLSSAGLTPVTVLAGATTFSFGSVPSGTAYTVTVTQPTSPSQTCVVTNGTGTVTTANVGNIAVACTTNSYTLGGTVSGLTGSGLVLSSAGLTPVTVLAGATTFSFGSVPSGTTYNVTATAQPASPTQNCVVANGIGTVTGANIANITVTCTTSSYTLGGTVSGLTGTGLVLSSTGLTPVTVTAGATTFSFGSVPSGTAYNVTVIQPTVPSQTCIVTNGTGTVTTANVGNIAVACTTNSYTLGGTVSGLTGTGLVLSSTGRTPVTITAGATTFSFGSVPSGTAYNVTATAQPASPTQNCVVANGTGTVTSANIANITVTCTTSSYALGGTVSGLTGTGLVLSSTGRTPVTVTAGATTFSFGSVPSGTAYNVTATAQPASPTQNCVVANGTGTVTSANIANITVTCTTNTYTVGGTISGLTGTGLVLLNNLGDSLSVPAAATSFVFATPVASGALYSVSVGTSPTGQTCTVTSGSGTVGGANITNVVLTCTP